MARHSSAAFSDLDGERVSDGVYDYKNWRWVVLHDHYFAGV